MSEHMMGIYHCWFQSASILLFIYLIIKQMFGFEPLKRWKPRIVIGVCHGEKIGYIPIPYKYIYIYIFIYIYLFIYWGMVINPFSLGFIYALKNNLSSNGVTIPKMLRFDHGTYVVWMI